MIWGWNQTCSSPLSFVFAILENIRNFVSEKYIK